MKYIFGIVGLHSCAVSDGGNVTEKVWIYKIYLIFVSLC